MIERFAKWVTTHPIIVLLLAIMCVGLMASGARLLSFSNDYRLFFSEENPQLQALEALQDTYTKSNNVIIVIAPDDKNIFTQKTLKVVEQLTEAAWQTPYSTRVDSITNFQHTYAEGDNLIVEDLVTDAEYLTDNELQTIRKIALSEPLLVNKLVPPQGHVTGISVAVYMPEKDAQKATPEVVNFIRSIVETAHSEHPDVEFHLTGIVVTNNALQEFTEADLTTLVPATFFVAVFGLALLLRTSSGTFSTVIVIFMSVAAAMGLAGWMGIVLTPSSIGAPTIIATLAIADCVHVLTNFLFAHRRNSNRQAAMIESLCLNFKPIFLTSVTTAIGLLAMNFSEAPPLHDLGNISAMGVLIAFLLSITLLPALMMIMPVRTPKSEEKLDTTMEFFSNFVIRHRDRLLWGMALLIIALATFIPNNQLDDQFVKFFDESTTIRQATDFTIDNLTGINEIHYSLSAGEIGGISNPQFLLTIEDFANWYRDQPGVLHVYSILDIVKRLNKNMHNDDPSWYRIPDERELSAQYLLFYEMSLPYGLDLNDRINIDKSATRLSVTLGSLSTNELLALENRAQQWLHKNAPSTMWTEGTSPPMVFAHIGYRNIRSMLAGTLAALILISIILIFTLRSFKIGLISLLPNLIPATMAFGIWGLMVGRIGFAMSVVASMSLGIIVDDTVHFLSKYLHARREKGMAAAEAVRYAFSTVGRALWVTSLVLISGFLVLSLSDFQFNSGTGALMAITIACALVADFFFLPPLLMKLDQEQPNKTTQQKVL